MTLSKYPILDTSYSTSTIDVHRCIRKITLSINYIDILT